MTELIRGSTVEGAGSAAILRSGVVSCVVVVVVTPVNGAVGENGTNDGVCLGRGTVGSKGDTGMIGLTDGVTG